MVFDRIAKTENVIAPGLRRKNSILEFTDSRIALNSRLISTEMRFLKSRREFSSAKSRLFRTSP